MNGRRPTRFRARRNPSPFLREGRKNGWRRRPAPRDGRRLHAVDVTASVEVKLRHRRLGLGVGSRCDGERVGDAGDGKTEVERENHRGTASREERREQEEVCVEVGDTVELAAKSVRDPNALEPCGWPVPTGKFHLGPNVGGAGSISLAAVAGVRRKQLTSAFILDVASLNPSIELNED